MIAIGAVVVVALVGLFAFMNKGGKPSPSSSNVALEDQGESMTKGSIKSLLGAGKSVTCEINYTDGKGKGTVYVDGKKFRGDFNVTVQDQPSVVSHMVSDGQMTFIWTEGSNQGTKMKLDAEAQTAASPSAQQQSTDLDKELDMKCSSWTVDNSKFEVPGTVTFTDVSAMIQKMQAAPSGAGVAKPDSSACDGITDADAKAACVAATSN